jgi:hypothetical protein
MGSCSSEIIVTLLRRFPFQKFIDWLYILIVKDITLDLLPPDILLSWKLPAGL